MNSRIRQFLHDEWLQLLMLLIPAAAAIAAMPFAKEPVPMQWNLRGQVNWYAPKEWGLLVMPGAMILGFAFWFWREAVDPGRQGAGSGGLTSHGKATRAVRLILSIAAGVICFVQISASLGRHLDMGRLAYAACPLLLACVGNFFGKLKPNRYMGVRVPWTLRSESVWRKTHRLTGWLYTVVGLVAAVLCLLAPTVYLVEISAAWLAIIILVPLGVAWQASRQERREQAAPGASAGLSLGWLAAIEAVVLVIITGLYFHNTMPGADPAHAPDRAAAQAAAEQWLVNVDEERYADAWAATGGNFHRLVKQQAEVDSLNKYRRPLGAARSRRLDNARYTESVPGAPPGKYVIVQFDTEFEKRGPGVETVVQMRENDGQWRVCGYFIK
ncbi:MAG: hypothetical protein JWO94_2577 [Verrucomicrobiaceae bacterium]|nr:hypothetical protein [Verrucomicrobiaceae bacterium]